MRKERGKGTRRRKPIEEPAPKRRKLEDGKLYEERRRCEVMDPKKTEPIRRKESETPETDENPKKKRKLIQTDIRNYEENKKIEDEEEIRKKKKQKARILPRWMLEPPKAPECDKNENLEDCLPNCECVNCVEDNHCVAVPSPVDMCAHRHSKPSVAVPNLVKSLSENCEYDNQSVTVPGPIDKCAHRHTNPSVAVPNLVINPSENCVTVPNLVKNPSETSPTLEENCFTSVATPNYAEKSTSENSNPSVALPSVIQDTTSVSVTNKVFAKTLSSVIMPTNENPSNCPSVPKASESPGVKVTDPELSVAVTSADTASDTERKMSVTVIVAQPGEMESVCDSKRLAVSVAKSGVIESECGNTRVAVSRKLTECGNSLTRVDEFGRPSLDDSRKECGDFLELECGNNLKQEDLKNKIKIQLAKETSKRRALLRLCSQTIEKFSDIWEEKIKKTKNKEYLRQKKLEENYKNWRAKNLKILCLKKNEKKKKVKGGMGGQESEKVWNFWKENGFVKGGEDTEKSKLLENILVDIEEKKKLAKSKKRKEELIEKCLNVIEENCVGWQHSLEEAEEVRLLAEINHQSEREQKNCEKKKEKESKLKGVHAKEKSEEKSEKIVEKENADRNFMKMTEKS